MSQEAAIYSTLPASDTFPLLVSDLAYKFSMIFLSNIPRVSQASSPKAHSEKQRNKRIRGKED